MGDKRDRRLQRIVELLEQKARWETAALSQELGVTELTVRRDIEQLDAQGIARRIYGGVELVPGSRSYEPPFSMRVKTNVESKKAMAAAAVDRIPHGANIAIDFGTKAYFVAQEMRARRLQARVAPSSVQVMEVLGHDNGLAVTVPGGDLKPGELSLHGSVAERFFASHRWDVAIVSVAGVHAARDLVSDYNDADARLKAAMLGSADRVVLLVEERHLGVVSFAPVGPLAPTLTVITDAPSNHPEHAALGALGVEVVGIRGDR